MAPSRSAWPGRDGLRLARRVTGSRPGSDGGVEQIGLRYSPDRAGQLDPGLGEELSPPFEPFRRVLRLERVRARELAERHLGVHLDHALVDLRERVHLQDLPAERERLLGDALPRDRPRDLVRLREGARLEGGARRGGKTLLARLPPTNARAAASVGRAPSPAGSIGMSTAITRARSDRTSVNVTCVETSTSPLGSSETATQPLR